MPPFIYAPYHNPYVGDIAQTMQRSGEIPAQAAVQIANANAAAQIASGRAYGNALTDIGNTIGSTVDRITDPRRQIEGLQLQQLQRQARSTMLFEAALKNPQNYKADGTLDDQAVTDQLRKQDVGAWQQWSQMSAAMDKHRLDISKDVAEINAKNADTATKAQALQDKQAEILGHIGYYGLQQLAQKPDDPLHARDVALASAATAVTRAGINPDDAKSFLMRTAQAGQQDLASVFASIVPPELKSKLDKEAADTSKSNAEAAMNNAKAANLAKYGRESLPEPQHVEFELDGKNVPGSFVPDSSGTGGRYFYNGQDVTAKIKAKTPASLIVQNLAGQAVSNLPPWAMDDSRPSGPDANKFEPSIRNTPNGLYQAALNYISSNQFPPTGRGNDPAAQAIRASIMSKVGAIAAAAGMDEPALRAFYKANAASLTQQQKLYDSAQQNLTTADRNVAELEKYLGKLPDLGSPVFNQPLRSFVKNVAGDPDMGPIGTYLQSVQNEYGRLINSANGSGQMLTDSARHEAQQLLDPNATVAQMLGSIHALKTEGGNRLVSIGEQIARIASRMKVGGGDGGSSSPPVVEKWERGANGQLQKVKTN